MRYPSKMQQVINLARRVLTKSHRRFIKFCIVGASGVFVNLGFVWLGQRFLFPDLETVWRNGASFLLGVMVATFSNFLLDDSWTWGDRDKTRHGFISRMLRFYLVSSLAIGIQWLVAMTLSSFWLTIHYQLAQLAGIAAATGLNFVANNIWTFRGSNE
jgi:dolichol-phosphate mannosyltransferase